MTVKVYLDSNIIIYRAEGEPDLMMKVRRLLTEYTSDGAQFWTSALAVGECLIGAYKKVPSTEETYHSAFEDRDFISVADVTHQIIERAAVLGAQLNMKLVDAIHVATAESLECKTFMTNDRGIRAPAGLELRYLSAEA
jgi:predicted nucleic acid-binding protein